MPNPRKVLNLDETIQFDDGPVHTKPFVMFGREWTLICDVNSFVLRAVDEPGGFPRLLNSLLPENERADFMAAISTQRGVSDEALIEMFKQLLAEAAERPTTPPSSLSPTRQPRTSPRKSVAPTSRTRAAR